VYVWRHAYQFTVRRSTIWLLHFVPISYSGEVVKVHIPNVKRDFLTIQNTAGAFSQQCSNIITCSLHIPLLNSINHRKTQTNYSVYTHEIRHLCPWIGRHCRSFLCLFCFLSVISIVSLKDIWNPDPFCLFTIQLLGLRWWLRDEHPYYWAFLFENLPSPKTAPNIDVSRYSVSRIVR